MKSLAPDTPVNLAIALGATTPVPSGGTGSIMWSTTTGGPLLWNGSNWVSLPISNASGAYSMPGSLSATGLTDNGSTIVNGGALYLQNGTSNWLLFNTNGLGSPTFTTRSPGTKAVWYPSVSGSLVDYATGMVGNTLWNSVPSASQQFQWYAGTALIGTLSGGGNLTITGEFIGSGAGLTAATVPNGALVTTPIDVSATAQTKAGPLTVSGILSSGAGINAGGSVGASTFGGFNIGTPGADTPWALVMGANIGGYKVSAIGTNHANTANGITADLLAVSEIGAGLSLALSVAGNLGIVGAFYGSGAGLTLATIPNGALVTTPIDVSATAQTKAGAFAATGITDNGTTTLAALNFAASGTQQNIKQSGTGLHIGPLGANTGPVDIFANGQGNTLTASFAANGDLGMLGGLKPGNNTAQGTAGFYSGTGAPTFSAANGSQYLRYDGTTGSRRYVNTSGASTIGTTWTAQAD